MPKILLVTSVTWSCAERLAGALTGADVEALFPAGHMLGVSRHVTRHHAYRALLPLFSIRRAIAKARPDLVIPCDDRAAQQLAALYARGTPAERQLLEFSLGAPGLYPRLTERTYFIAQAAEAGVLAAGMLPVSDSAALERGLESLGLPLVIKSDFSFGGEGVVIARSKAEARAVYARMAKPASRLRSLARAFRRRDLHFVMEALHPRRPVIGLQRFIPGKPATSSLLCWQGEVLAANHFDVEMMQHTNGPSSVLTRRDCAQMDDAARRIARHFGLSGLHGLDYLRDANGQAHLLEINARATPTSHLALGPGHDIGAALLEQLGVRDTARPPVTNARQIALFPQEWRRDRASPFLTSAYHDIPRNDPGVVRGHVLATSAALNDDLAGEITKFMALQGLREDWTAPALTIRQAARP